MAVRFKDYYEVLGIPRKSTEAEIKKAFRTLARKYHPDVAQDKKEAEDRFKEINEAYEVLGDPAKRKKYDQLGPNWKQGADFRPPPNWDGGGANRGGEGFGDASDFEFSGTGFSDFFSQLFGANRRHGPATEDRHRAPGGGFAIRGRDLEADIMVTLEEALLGAIRSISMRRSDPCGQCQGTGRFGPRPCPGCNGTGHVTREELCQVKVPAGVKDGQLLRVAGKGERGRTGGASGDLFLRVTLAKHPDFRVVDGHLYVDVTLAPWEVVLGTQRSVPTLEGRIKIKIPPGTQPGQQLRLRSKGIGKEGERGDLIVVARVEVPQEIGVKERELWEALAKESKSEGHP